MAYISTRLDPSHCPACSATIETITQGRTHEGGPFEPRRLGCGCPCPGALRVVVEQRDMPTLTYLVGSDEHTEES
jgi:hypothetical protein